MADVPEYESRALSALVFSGRLDANEISHQATIPSSKVYSVLDGLIQRGLAYCHDDTARPKVYVAARPDIIHAQLTEKLRKIDRTSRALDAELTLFYEHAAEAPPAPSITDYVRTQSSLAGMKSETSSAIRGAKKLYAVGRDFSWLEDLPRVAEDMKNLAQRGGLRLLTSHKSLTVDLKTLVQAGAAIRHFGDLASRFMVLDDRSVFLAIKKRNPKATESEYILVKIASPELAKDLMSLFETWWTDGVPMAGT